MMRITATTPPMMAAVLSVIEALRKGGREEGREMESERIREGGTDGGKEGRREGGMQGRREGGWETIMQPM